MGYRKNKFENRGAITWDIGRISLRMEKGGGGIKQDIILLRLYPVDETVSIISIERYRGAYVEGRSSVLICLVKVSNIGC